MDSIDWSKMTENDIPEQLYRQFFLLNPDGISISDADGKLVYFSPRIGEIFAFPEPEIVLGKSIMDWIDPAHHAKAKKNLHAVIHGGEREDNTYLLVKYSGERFFGAINSAPLRDQAGNFFGLISSIRDISDAVRLQQTLSQREERYRAIAELLSEGLVLVGQDQTVCEWNRAMELITGILREDILGKNFLHVITSLVPEGKVHPGQIQKLTEALTMLLETGIHPMLGKPVELDIFALDGTFRKVQQKSFVISLDTGFQVGAVVVDLTKHVLAEKELLIKEGRYRLLFEAAYDSIFLMDREIFVECNNRTLELFGCSRQDIIGHPPYLFSPPVQPDGRDSREKALEKIDAALSGEPQRFEWVHKRRDGSLFDAEVYLNALKINSNVLLQAIVRDITQRKKSDERSRKFNECLLSFSTDNDQNIRQLLQVCGETFPAAFVLYNRLEEGRLTISGQWNVPEAFDPADGQGCSICREIIQTGNSMPVSVRNLKESPYRDTSPMILQWDLQSCFAMAVRFGGKIVGSICLYFQGDFVPDQSDELFLDMICSAAGLEEERRITNLMLREEEKKYREMYNMFRLLTDNMTDLLWAKDLQKRFIFTNKAHREQILNALSENEPIGKTDMFFADREREQNSGIPEYHTFGEVCTDSDEVVLQTAEPHRFEESGNVKGSFLVLDVRKAPIFDEHGVMIGTVGSGRDVTHEKETEARLKSLLEELKELNISKDKFFSIIAHDLKGPFNAILGFTELLTTDWEEFSEEERRHLIRNIRTSASLTYRLLENLLDWSRAQTGRMDFQPALIDLSGIANDTLILLREMADQKQIRIFSEINFNTIAFADENMVKTIFRNLVNNAIKFSHPGSQVHISAREEPMSASDISMIRIEIKDRGVGITLADQSRLFRIDEQFRMPGTANEKGTGIGLVLCKELAEKNLGTISVESEPDKGSIFAFTLRKNPF